VPSTRLPPIHQNNAGGERVNALELRAECGAHHYRQRGGHLNASRSGAHQNECEKVAVLARVFLNLRLLERLEDSISDFLRVSETLQAGCEPFKFVAPEINCAARRSPE
jgi:hypothetical protein